MRRGAWAGVLRNHPMEAFMKLLAPVIAFALMLAWPSVGEAASKKSSARSKAVAQQSVQRPAAVARPRAGQPCAGYAWWGCTGWDPDPNVRAMLARDVGQDD
jgi:hypothetical protein